MSRLLLVLALLSATAPATAQEVVRFEDFTVAGTFDGSAVNLAILLQASSVYDGAWLLDTVVGLDIYRRSLAGYPNTHQCAQDEIRVNAVPLPWNQTATTPISFRDDSVEPDRWYLYTVRLVTAGREIVPSSYGFGFDLDGPVKTGNAPFAHGTMEHYLGGLWSIFQCPSECGWFSDITIDATIDPSHNQAYLFYGDVSFRDSHFGYRAHVTAIEPAPCLVAIEPSSWAGVKSLYR